MQNAFATAISAAAKREAEEVLARQNSSRIHGESCVSLEIEGECIIPPQPAISVDDTSIHSIPATYITSIQSGEFFQP